MGSELEHGSGEPNVNVKPVSSMAATVGIKRKALQSIPNDKSLHS